MVADAGLPNMYAYQASDGDWSGERVPARIDRIMDEQTFHMGRYDPQEGGPKGLEVIADRFVALTSAFQPLAFFALAERAVHGDQSVTGGDVAAPDDINLRTPILRAAQRLRATADESARMTGELATLSRQRDDLAAEVAACRHDRDEERRGRSEAEQAADEARDELELLRRQHADAAVEMDRLIDRVEVLEAHIDAMYASTSWRWSAPLRAGSWLLQRARSLRH